MDSTQRSPKQITCDNGAILSAKINGSAKSSIYYWYCLLSLLTKVAQSSRHALVVHWK
jgi:hypothetical protein